MNNLKKIDFVYTCLFEPGEVLQRKTGDKKSHDTVTLGSLSCL